MFGIAKESEQLGAEASSVCALRAPRRTELTPCLGESGHSRGPCLPQGTSASTGTVDGLQQLRGGEPHRSGSAHICGSSILCGEGISLFLGLEETSLPGLLNLLK